MKVEQKTKLKDEKNKAEQLIKEIETAKLYGIAAAFGAGPAGGAAAGFVLRLGNDLLAGDKLSTAVGKGAKTAVAGFLAGKAFEFLGAELKDFLGGQTMEQLNANVGELQSATFDGAQEAAQSQYGEAARVFDQMELSDMQIVNRQELTSINEWFGIHGTGGDILLFDDQVDKLNQLLKASDTMVGRTADSYGQMVPNRLEGIGKAFEYARNCGDENKQLQGMWEAGKTAADAIANAGKDALADPEITSQIASLTGEATNDISVMQNIADLAAAAGQGAATAATIPGKKAEPEAEEKPKAESIDYDLLYTKHLSGIPLNEAEQQLVNEIGMADIKRGAAKAADFNSGRQKRI